MFGSGLSEKFQPWWRANAVILQFICTVLNLSVEWRISGQHSEMSETVNGASQQLDRDGTQSHKSQYTYGLFMGLHLRLSSGFPALSLQWRTCWELWVYACVLGFWGTSFQARVPSLTLLPFRLFHFSNTLLSLFACFDKLHLLRKRNEWGVTILWYCYSKMFR